MHKFLRILLLFAILTAQAQEGVDSFLQTIETNNKMLNAAGKLKEVEKLQANTDRYLPNPAVSYDLLDIGGDQTFSEMVISQEFDFPTTYGHKKKIASVNEQISENNYRITRMEVFNEALAVYAQIISQNRKMLIHQHISDMLQVLEKNVKRKLELGESNIIEYNRVLTETSINNASMRLLQADKKQLWVQLTRLNGGSFYEISDTEFPVFEPVVYDSALTVIMSKHPYQYLWNDEIKKAEYEIKLQKAVSLPGFEIGYRQDRAVDDVFSGISAGISIPLFENKNKVKAATARQQYLVEESGSQLLSVEKDIENQLIQLQALEEANADVQETLYDLNTPELLLKAYEGGQIDYTDFFLDYNNYQKSMLFAEDLQLDAMLARLKVYVLMHY